ncbi:MAG: tetratricopeptide repeat-containing sensor histidine kinase [Pedobacter sp.]|nr:MAG: tetratricopeptide repeat-containing sensor histidine kinase [Pedobacter sp.]
MLACTKKKVYHTPAVVKDPDYEKAKALLSINKDSAFYYFNRVTTQSKDSLTVAIAYNFIAALESDAGDNFGAQESLLSSLKFLNEKNPKHYSCLSSDYNELGLASLNLKNYEAAISYFDTANKFNKNKGFRAIGANNKALAYQNLGQYNKAIQIYQTVLSKQNQPKVEYARTLSNLTVAKWRQNPNHNPLPDLQEGLEIRESEKDEWGQNSSYAYLSEYFQEKNPVLALSFAIKMYRISRKIDSPDDQLEALQKLIKSSTAPDTKRYFDAYSKLADSIQTARSNAKNQFALIRYGVEKSKVENLELQRDNTLKKYQIATREFLLTISILVFISAAIGGTIFFKRRKRRMEADAKAALRESQLKTSKRVHDVVANGLYRVMTEIGNQKVVDKERVLDKIEDLYEKSRDISYEKSDDEVRDFNKQISELLTSFATEQTKILIVGNYPALWEKVSESVRYEIEQVVQELMVNMRKHSQATNVVLKFEQKDNDVNIYYTDNGIGMPQGVQEKNGLRNTGNRMADVNGSITFDTKVDKGLKIQLSFPVS